MVKFIRKDSKGALSFNNVHPGTFDDNFSLGKVLGRGGYAIVKDAIHVKTKKTYAVKIVDVNKLGKRGEPGLLGEIKILKKLRHPNIIGLFDVYKHGDFYYLVTEKMLGGELFDRIVEKTCYNEEEARDTCMVLLKAIQYIHKKRVAHRDLKPENLLLHYPHNDTAIKLADFGFAKKVKTPRSLTTLCGTPGYVAPEIYRRKPYDVEVDMWSLGVIIFILLGGYAPFDDDDGREVQQQLICRGQYEFEECYWGHVSNDAKDLIRGLLTVKRDNRLTADKALRNRWMRADGKDLSTSDLSINLEEFKKYNGKRKVKAAVKTVMAAKRMNDIVGKATSSTNGIAAAAAAMTSSGSLSKSQSGTVSESEFLTSLKLLTDEEMEHSKRQYEEYIQESRQQSRDGYTAEDEWSSSLNEQQQESAKSGGDTRHLRHSVTTGQLMTVYC